MADPEPRAGPAAADGGERRDRADGEDGRRTAPAPGDERPADRAGERSREDRRRAVEETYDFDEFGPADMAEMTAEEWDAAFDPDSWITGPELLDRLERDLRARVASRDVFAVVERDVLPEGQRLVAYSDEGYAVVYEDGTVEGSGTVLRDVEPSVALASMDSYEVPEVPEGEGRLPSPAEVPEGTGRLGHRLLEFVAGVQVLAGLVVFGAWLRFGLSVVAPIVAVGFLLFGLVLFVMVANARLSDRFRAERFRERLRSAGVESGERPPFVPAPDDPLDATRADGRRSGGSDDADPAENAGTG